METHVPRQEMAYRWHGRSLGGGHRARLTPPDAPGGDETEPRHRRDKTETLSWKLRYDKWFCLTISLLVILFASAFMVQSKQMCKGPSICAEARVYGGSKLTAKARVSSPSSVDGRWTYSLRVGNLPQSDQNLYWGRISKKWEISKYTSTASAYASNHGGNRSGTTYYAYASESSGG